MVGRFLDIYPRPRQDCGQVGPRPRRALRMRPVGWFKCARPNAETVIQIRWIIAPRWENSYRRFCFVNSFTMSLTSPSITFFADFGLNESLVPVQMSSPSGGVAA